MQPRTQARVGAGALEKALDLIGEPDKTDHDLAKIIVDNEVELRALVRYAIGPRPQ